MGVSQPPTIGDPKVPPTFTLRDRFLGASVLLTLLVLGGVLFFLNTRLSTTSQQTVITGLTDTLSFFQQGLQTRSDRLRARALAVASHPRVADALSPDPFLGPFPAPPSIPELCLALRDLAASPLFVLTNAEGRVLFDSTQPSEEILALQDKRAPVPEKVARENETPRILTDWPQVREALSGRPVDGAWLYISPANPNEPVFYQTTSLPLQTADEKIVGAIVLGFPLDRNLALELRRGFPSEAAFEAGGKVLASTWKDSNNGTLVEALAASAGQAEVWLRGENLVRPQPVTLNGDKYLALFYPLADPRGQTHGHLVILNSMDRAAQWRRHLKMPLQLLALLALASAYAFAFLASRRVTLPLAELRRAADQAGRGDLTAEVPVRSKDELGDLETAFNRMMTNLRQRERVTHILGKYVSPETARQLLSSEDGVALKGERRECAILHTNLRGFTAFSSHLAPDKLVADLNEYFGRMEETVFDHQGTLDKFMGDSLLALWGAPVPIDDKELSAVRCALEMRSALQKLNDERSHRGAPPLAAGMGIACGFVVAGNLGSERRIDYTVIGEEVNLAIRLCAKAAPGQILVSEAVYKKLKGQVAAMPLEPLPLKGFSEPVKSYEVTGLVS